ncbi:hypothetical protein HDU82_000574 [Entophlyctis luteolus]|nr:hypothetical protein HDU82_000574 [Entophlyctis luteolus]
MESHISRTADPKLAAYMFAGRAFFIGTALTLSGTLSIVAATAAALDVGSLKEFSAKMKTVSNSGMPLLKGKYDENAEDELDAAAKEFLAELRDDSSAERPQNRYEKEISSRIKKELGKL